MRNINNYTNTKIKPQKNKEINLTKTVNTIKTRMELMLIAVYLAFNSVIQPNVKNTTNFNNSGTKIAQLKHNISIKIQIAGSEK